MKNTIVRKESYLPPEIELIEVSVKNIMASPNDPGGSFRAPEDNNNMPGGWE